MTRYRTLSFTTGSAFSLLCPLADPLYLDAENRDFRLQPDRPNIGAGKDGATIGALGPAD